MMEYWKNGRMEEWNGGMLEEWKNGRMEWWNVGRMEEWNGGMMDRLKTRTGTSFYVGSRSNPEYRSIPSCQVTVIMAG
jgi:hypothetical protein